MSEISNIIRNTLGDNTRILQFEGEVYFEHENQLYDFSERVGIDRDVFNKVLNVTNAAYDHDENLLDAESDLLLIFTQDYFIDESGFWEEKKMNYHNSLIILDGGILNSFVEENLSKGTKEYRQTAVVWEEIDQVELFSNDGKDCFFRFYYKNETSHEDIFALDFCTSDLESCRILNGLFNQIVEYKKQTTENSINEHASLKTKIEEIIYTNENYFEALKELEVFKDIYDVENISNDNAPFYHLNKSFVLLKLQRYDEALDVVENFMQKFPDSNDIPPYSYQLKGEIFLQMNNFLAATKNLALGEEGYENIAFKKEALALKENSYSMLKKVFLDIPYNHRKLVFIGNNIYATQSSEILILKKNDLPSNINFPIGHPHINEIYTCHPHKQNFYLPLKDYSEELFLDRINEFSYLLQCLGATKLEISSTKSNSLDQKLVSKKEIDANVDYKINSAKVNYKGESTENTLVDGKLKIAKTQVFKPVKAPFIPANLIWYHSDLNWQRLVDQRLNGNILTHSELISSSQSENISSHELKQIDAELKLLLPKIGVSYNSENEICTSTIKSHEWLVTVEFEDTDNLLYSNKDFDKELVNDSSSISKEYSLNLEKYKEDVLFMIEDDGVIDEMERNILNRKIKRYGISEEDAKAIEIEVSTSGYSESEQNYIQELKEFLEDGVINDIDRKILDRYALKFGLNKDKQLEIEKMFIK